MMLEHLGYEKAGAEVLQAIEKVLSRGADEAPLTGDLGGKGNTRGVKGQAIADAL